jgi:hypothetical protein
MLQQRMLSSGLTGLYNRIVVHFKYISRIIQLKMTGHL